MKTWGLKLLPLLIIATLLFVFYFFFPNYLFAKSGCCSWHKGVCSCDTSVGRQICCDGTYSPSCTCAYIAPAPVYTPVPTPRPTPIQTPIATPLPIQTSTIPNTPTPTVQGTASKSSGTVESLFLAFFIGLPLWILYKYRGVIRERIFK